MTVREREMAKIRKLLDPSFAAMWNREFSRQDRRWFLECASVNKSSGLMWAEFTSEEQAAIRRAYATFMRGSQVVAHPLPAFV